jgi:hypothetical protein
MLLEEERLLKTGFVKGGTAELIIPIWAQDSCVDWELASSLFPGDGRKAMKQSERGFGWNGYVLRVAYARCCRQRDAGKSGIQGEGIKRRANQEQQGAVQSIEREGHEDVNPGEGGET